MKFGIEIFGAGKIHWYFDTASLDKIVAINAKMMQDHEFTGLLERAKGLWFEGDLEDTVLAQLSL
jgi:hypothetical protein